METYSEDRAMQNRFSLASLYSVIQPDATIGETILFHNLHGDALTPDKWDPHNDAYAYNEENMLDWEGNMHQGTER